MGLLDLTVSMPGNEFFHVEELDENDEAGFNQLYDIYASLFPLPDEREPPEAFKIISKLNKDKKIQALYGPYREIVAAIRLGKQGPIIGGHIFGVTTSSAHDDAGIPASVQAIYTFLKAEFRGHDSLKFLLDFSRNAAQKMSRRGLKHTRLPLIIFEVNNPLKMLPIEIDEDVLHSGLHPARRYMLWLRSGFTPLKFPYVQPRLSVNVQPVKYLDLFCDSWAKEGIPSAVLLNHLRSFISILRTQRPRCRKRPRFRGDAVVAERTYKRRIDTPE